MMLRRRIIVELPALGVGAAGSLPAAIGMYLPWAVLQQLLFRFYLLGWLRTLWPSFPGEGISVLNGIAFGLVHPLDGQVVLAAILGGTAWSYLSLRDRFLWPLAVSQAVTGSMFYARVASCDLATDWAADPRVANPFLEIGL